MSIPFTCPHCGVTAQADDQYAGQTGPCASCGAAVTIPAMPGVSPSRRSAGCAVAVIVVALLMGLLICGGMLGLTVFTRQVIRDAARGTLAHSQIAQLGTALESYNLDVRAYPTTEQGLDALLQCPVDLPDANAWNGPYVVEIPTDLWGNSFQYVYPGADEASDTPDLWSMGPDGISGTEDDIAGWEEELPLR